MKIISDKSIRENIRKYGFQSVSPDVSDVMNESLDNFLENTFTKAKKLAKNQNVTEQHVMKVLGYTKQNGGAETVMPLEYYGIDSGHYHTSPDMGVDTRVTNDFIRPAMNVNDPSGLFESGFMKGGGSGCPCKDDKKFSLSKSAMTKACSQHGAAMSPRVRKLLEKKFEMEFDKVMSKVQNSKNTSSHLSGGSIDKILSQRKFSKLFKE